jgi:hypothetical protein
VGRARVVVWNQQKGARKLSMVCAWNAERRGDRREVQLPIQRVQLVFLVLRSLILKAEFSVFSFLASHSDRLQHDADVASWVRGSPWILCPQGPFRRQSRHR